MRTVETINFIIMCLFFLCYAYQFFYVGVAWWKKAPSHQIPTPHRLAILIAARNEAAVIGNLLQSIAQQDYPRELVDVFVCADHCTDATAAIARWNSAHVLERYSGGVGKGYVLEELLRFIRQGGFGSYDAYVVLDADNVLDPHFLTEMNRTFSDGSEIVTCYRNSKNYGDNWISAGYALWFLREAQYLNRPRCLLGSSCAVSGTGFLFSQRIAEKCGGWPFHMLTEDIEFTIHNVIDGERVGYARDAILYDEQPTTFSQSWRQRLRWGRGYLQVFGRYGGGLLRGICRGSFSCYDMAMNIMPAAVLTGVSIVVNLCAAIGNFSAGGDWGALGISVLQTLISLYATLFALGAVTTISEWRSIHCSTAKKLLYALTFPLFMLTYVPICICSLFSNAGWEPIHHTRVLSLREITAEHKSA